MRTVVCRWCTLPVSFMHMQAHQSVCGSANTTCSACNRQVMKRQLKRHTESGCQYPNPSAPSPLPPWENGDKDEEGEDAGTAHNEDAHGGMDNMAYDGHDSQEEMQEDMHKRQVLHPHHPHHHPHPHPHPHAHRHQEQSAPYDDADADAGAHAGTYQEQEPEMFMTRAPTAQDTAGHRTCSICFAHVRPVFLEEHERLCQAIQDAKVVDRPFSGLAPLPAVGDIRTPPDMLRTMTSNELTKQVIFASEEPAEAPRNSTTPPDMLTQRMSAHELTGHFTSTSDNTAENSSARPASRRGSKMSNMAQMAMSNHHRRNSDSPDTGAGAGMSGTAQQHNSTTATLVLPRYFFPFSSRILPHAVFGTVGICQGTLLFCVCVARVGQQMHTRRWCSHSQTSVGCVSCRCWVLARF